jgi:hypothetical protein
MELDVLRYLSTPQSRSYSKPSRPLTAKTSSHTCATEFHKHESQNDIPSANIQHVLQTIGTPKARSTQSATRPQSSAAQRQQSSNFLSEYFSRLMITRPWNGKS